MHVGMALIFQGQGENRGDADVYRNELRLGSLAEPLSRRVCWSLKLSDRSVIRGDRHRRVGHD